MLNLNIVERGTHFMLNTKQKATLFLIKAQKKALKIIEKQNYEIMNPPQNKKSITVITPVYNAEKFIERTINSVINQSIGFENIQYILIDDCSTDQTKKLIQKYAEQYDNICAVFLKENSGTPGTPRNIGIELANSKYISFLDADDWFHQNGLETLYNILEETNDDLAVGKSIKVKTDLITYTGAFYTHTERRSISPFDERMLFHHCAPPSRMMKLSIIKENNIRFPEMKFSEDKAFFMNFLLHAKKISITTKPIYYINRTNENSNSLTQRTNPVQKRLTDFKIIEFIKSKKLPIEQEKIILNRIFELDFLTRTFNTKKFVKYRYKFVYFYLLKRLLKTTKTLRYDFKEEIKDPLYTTALNLYSEGRKEDFINLFKWSKYENDKKIVIKNQLPYYEIPFLSETDAYKYIRKPMFAKTKKAYAKDQIYFHEAEVYGDYCDKICSILIRDRKNATNEIEVECICSENKIKFQVDIKMLESLGKGRFSVFIKYNNYELIRINHTKEVEIKVGGKKFKFYSTKYTNLALLIK